MEAKHKVSVSRIAAKSRLPYFTNFILCSTPVPMPGIGTAAVDKWGRMYYDPAFVESIDMDQMVFVTLHEICHLAMQHHRRSLAYFGRVPDAAEALLWNVAGDLCINTILRDTGCKLVKNIMLPELFKLPENLSTEVYYELLREKASQVQQAYAGDGKEGRNGGRPGEGGSAADGVRRPWEHPGPGDDDAPSDPNSVPPAIGELDQTIMARQAAEQVEASRSRGNIPAGLRRWADEIIKPKIDPRRELLSLVRHGLSQAAGNRDFTYQKPSRRRVPCGVVLPAMRCPVPRVTIAVDTSGSMGAKDLGLALGLVGSVVKALPDQRGVRVLAGDMHVAAAKQVFRPEQVELAGGGGTDMAKVIEQAAAERARPQFIVLVTDGYTPWPTVPLPMPVVACLTTPGGNVPPAWMKVVQLECGGA